MLKSRSKDLCDHVVYSLVNKCSPSSDSVMFCTRVALVWTRTGRKLREIRVWNPRTRPLWDSHNTRTRIQEQLYAELDRRDP